MINGKPPFDLNDVSQATLEALAVGEALPHEITGEQVIRDVDFGTKGAMDQHDIARRMDPHDLRLVAKIVERFSEVAARFGIGFDRNGAAVTMMDLCNVHLHNRPFNFLALLMSSDDDLTHDVLGVMRYIDRTNGRLREGFTPRHWRKAT